MNILKNNKGITLLALTITIIVMVIITGTLIYNANNQLHIKKIDNLYSDIEQIRDRVSQYYIKYGKLPVKGRYCTANELVEILKQNGADSLKTQEDLLDINDKKDPDELTYYVIDLSKLDNLTLYYGSKFKDWTPNVEVNTQTGEETYSSSTTEQDLYIINEKSHQIYYPMGVLVEGKIYYSYKISPMGNQELPVEQFQIQNLQIMNTKEGETEKRIFEYASAVQNDIDEIYIAKDGKVDLRANVLLKVPNGKTISHVYYEIIEENYNAQDFLECAVNRIEDEVDNDEDNATYAVSVISSKMPAGVYDLWLRIIDEEGNETITDEHIQNPEGTTNVKNKVRILEKGITLSVPTLTSNPAPSLPVDNVEVTIKYDANKLSNISYGEGLTLEQAQDDYKPITSNEPYTEDQVDGERIYTLVVKEDEYLSVKAQDPYGNITTSYISLQDVLTLKEFDRNATEGKIDVVWLDTNNNVISSPNAPVLKIKDENQVEWGLTAVDYDANEPDHWKAVADPVNTEWYKYIAQPDKVGDNEQGTSRWANARANDGSLFVWIPRYAYKITYYNADKTEILGYSTNRGIINAKGRVIYPTDENYADNYQVKTEGYRDYIVHPAFTKDAANGGGWDNELEGIWFGKFEAVRNTTDTSVKVVAGVSSWRNLVINEMYNYGLTATYGGSNNSSNILQSHMIKNSDWGAVAYLAHSQYGLSGGKSIKNTSSAYHTGGSDIATTIYGNNIYQSTTHNVYGIYDLSGSLSKYVASYVNNGHTNLSNNGNYNSDLIYRLYGVTIDERKTSTKFKTVYSSFSTAGGKDTQSQDYYKNSMFRGDAVLETSSSYAGQNSWYLSNSFFPTMWNSFFLRGGIIDDSDSTMFSMYIHTGNAGGIGFRVALCY